MQSTCLAPPARTKKLNAYLGARFEEHTLALLSRCYPTQGPRRVLFPAEEYGTADEPKEGTDGVLTIGDAAITTHIGSARPTG